MTLSTSSLNFSYYVVGTPSLSQTVTLTNSGTATLTVNSLGSSGDFAQTNTCGGSVNTGASCTISVTLAPSSRDTPKFLAAEDKIPVCCCCVI